MYFGGHGTITDIDVRVFWWMGQLTLSSSEAQLCLHIQFSLHLSTCQNSFFTIFARRCIFSLFEVQVICKDHHVLLEANNMFFQVLSTWTYDRLVPHMYSDHPTLLKQLLRGGLINQDGGSSSLDHFSLGKRD